MQCENSNSRMIIQIVYLIWVNVHGGFPKLMQFDYSNRSSAGYKVAPSTYVHFQRMESNYNFFSERRVSNRFRKRTKPRILYIDALRVFDSASKTSGINVQSNYLNKPRTIM
jgi:hypothetical protein